MAKDKINEATTVASSRSRGGNKKDNKTKQQLGTARELLFTQKIKRLFNMLEDNNASYTIARPNKLN
jgi:hypothetical protein